MKRLVAVILLFLPMLAGAAAPDSTDYFSDNTLRYENHIYRKNIKTPLLIQAGLPMSDPVIRLNGTEQLELSFDDLDSDYKTYYYTIIHCSSNWQPSNIMNSEYLDGFYDNPINDYRYSRNTMQKYTHFFVKFPNENLKILRSGNYIIKVFLDNDHEKLVLTRRFMVYEEKVSITGRAHQATIIEDRNYKQEVDFTINASGQNITNPYSELSVVLSQNNRMDNAITSLKPQFVKGDELVYDYDDVNVFKGGSEFRLCDTRSLRYQNERIAKFTYEDKQNHVYMISDDKRTFKRYVSQNDINGRYLIHMEDFEASFEGDYAWVHFFLPLDPPTTEGNIYIFGGFTDWACKPEYKMQYNKERKGYEATLYMKQGYYNYEYVILRDNEKAADDFFVEGMHWETTNEYFIYVYQRAPGMQYDQLVGYKRIGMNQQ